MSEEDRERLMELCKREIYAYMLGADYQHDDEDKRWWINLKHACPEEFSRVVKLAKREYGYDDWRWRNEHGTSRQPREKA